MYIFCISKLSDCQVFQLVKWISCNKGLKAKMSCFLSYFFSFTLLRLECSRIKKTALFLTSHVASLELHKWSKNVVNVENYQFLKENCKFLSVKIEVKWKQKISSITLFCSSTQCTFYSLFLLFFVLEIKFKYDKFFVRHSSFISKFKWFEPSCLRNPH